MSFGKFEGGSKPGGGSVAVRLRQRADRRLQRTVSRQKIVARRFAANEHIQELDVGEGLDALQVSFRFHGHEIEKDRVMSASQASPKTGSNRPITNRRSTP